MKNWGHYFETQARKMKRRFFGLDNLSDRERSQLTHLSEFFLGTKLQYLKKFLTRPTIRFALLFFWWLIVEYTRFNRLAKFQSCRPPQKKSGNGANKIKKKSAVSKIPSVVGKRFCVVLKTGRSNVHSTGIMLETWILSGLPRLGFGLYHLELVIHRRPLR